MEAGDRDRPGGRSPSRAAALENGWSSSASGCGLARLRAASVSHRCGGSGTAFAVTADPSQRGFHGVAQRRCRHRRCDDGNEPAASAGELSRAKDAWCWSARSHGRTARHLLRGPWLRCLPGPPPRNRVSRHGFRQAPSTQALEAGQPSHHARSSGHHPWPAALHAEGSRALRGPLAPALPPECGVRLPRKRSATLLPTPKGQPRRRQRTLQGGFRCERSKGRRSQTQPRRP